MARLTILVDVGETRGGVPDALRELGCEVVLERLAAGDYRIGQTAAVERKTVADLHRSIAVGRLWAQLERLRGTYDRAWLLVEGDGIDEGQLSTAGVRGALLSVIDTGIPIIWSRTARDSALWIARLATRAQSRRGAGEVWRMRAPRRTRRASPNSVLCAIPGISPDLASRLLEEFGSIEAVATASNVELTRVKGIGAARSTQIARLLTGTSRAARSAH